MGLAFNSKEFDITSGRDLWLEDVGFKGLGLGVQGLGVGWCTNCGVRNTRSKIKAYHCGWSVVECDGPSKRPKAADNHKGQRGVYDANEFSLLQLPQHLQFLVGAANAPWQIIEPRKTLILASIWSAKEGHTTGSRRATM